MSGRLFCAGTPFAVLAVFGLAVLMTAACGGERTEVERPDAGEIAGQTALACTTRADCTNLGPEGKGLICGASFRCEHCGSDSQCGLKERCDDEIQRCVFKDGFGDECVFNDECPGSGFCVQGLCRSALDVAFCTPEGTCLAQGQVCSRINGVCEADLGCLSDSDCTPGTEVCNLPTRTCAAACSEETYQTACRPGQFCLRGRCSDCESDSSCAPGFSCDQDRLICAVAGSFKRCVRDEDCENGMKCQKDISACMPSKPHCTSDSSCDFGQTCNLASGKCVSGSCQPDRFEPNDTMEAAFAVGRDLSAGIFSSLTLCGGETDFYTVHLQRGDALNVNFNGDALLSGRIAIAILDARGRSLGRGSLSASGTAAEDGRHAISVSTDEKWVSYGLTISIGRGTPCDFDRFEPNDFPEAATLISGEQNLGDLTICGGDEDYFAVEVPEGMKPILRTSLISGSAAVDIEEIFAGAEEAAGYEARRLFRVSSPLSRAASVYSLSLRFVPAGSEASDD